MMHIVPKLVRAQVPNGHGHRSQLLLALLLSSTAWQAHAQPAPPSSNVVPAVPIAVSNAAPIAAPNPAPNVALNVTPNLGSVPAAPGRSPVVGATARHLLEAQSSGRIAAPGKPMSGATASASWKRYVDTFSHPVPEFFESRVGKKTSE